MSAAIQNLETDHQHILRLIGVMERITLTTDPDMQHLDTVLMVIREFADGLHHAKEEKHLFPLMAAKGYSTEKGPVAVMLYEHEMGRNFVKGIAEGISQMRAGEPESVNYLYANMIGYVDLLKNHISKENNVLFPMADNAFTNTEKENLFIAFAEVESIHAAGEGKQDYISLIEKLAAIYSA
jgi:hemerythrin-like domain-containing protein